MKVVDMCRQGFRGLTERPLTENGGGAFRVAPH